MSYLHYITAFWAITVGSMLLAVVIASLASYLESTFIMILAGVLLVVTFIAPAVWEIHAIRTTASTVQVHIKSKERVNESSSSSRYLVYTDNEVFENTDAFWSFGKTNSSDLYGNLNPGSNYSCKVAGWRVHFFSEYRNLISCSAIQ